MTMSLKTAKLPGTGKDALIRGFILIAARLG